MHKYVKEAYEALRNPKKREKYDKVMVQVKSSARHCPASAPVSIGLSGYTPAPLTAPAQQSMLEMRFAQPLSMAGTPHASTPKPRR